MTWMREACALTGPIHRTQSGLPQKTALNYKLGDSRIPSIHTAWCVFPSDRIGEFPNQRKFASSFGSRFGGRHGWPATGIRRGSRQTHLILRCWPSPVTARDEASGKAGEPRASLRHRHAVALRRPPRDPPGKRPRTPPRSIAPDILTWRQVWFDSQPDLDPERLIFIDETWVSTNMARTQRRTATTSPPPYRIL
jgi:hypothetical protein